MYYLLTTNSESAAGDGEKGDQGRSAIGRPARKLNAGQARKAQAQRSRCRCRRRRPCGCRCGWRRCGVVVSQRHCSSSLSSSVATRRRRDVRRQRPKERKKEVRVRHGRRLSETERESKLASANGQRKKEGRRPKRSWGAARSVKLQAAESSRDRNSLSVHRLPTHPPTEGRDRPRCGSWLSLAASSVSQRTSQSVSCPKSEGTVAQKSSSLAHIPLRDLGVIRRLHQ